MNPTVSDAPPLSAAQAAERRVQLALWASGESVWEWCAATNLIVVDAHVPGTGDGEGLLALPRAEAGLTPDDFFARAHAEDLPALRQAWSLHLSGAHADIDVSFRIPCADGRLRWLRVRGRALARDRDGRALRLLGTLRDVTAQREAEESLRLMAHAFASTRDALAVVDAGWQLLEVNEALVHLAGDDSGLMPGSDLRRWLPLPDEVAARVLADGIWSAECVLHGAAEAVPVEVSITAVDGAAGAHQGLLVALHDLRERRRHEERLQRMATVDELTGLPNRLAGQMRLDAALARPGAAFGLLYLDLDAFKEINDSCGHDRGDALLAAVGQRLRTALPEAAQLAHWGGDKFMVQLPQGSADTEVRTAAQGVLAALAGPFDVGGQDVRVTVALGAVLVPRDGADTRALLRRCDLALYAAKAQGRNAFAYFDPALESGAERRVRMTSLLREDTLRNAFHFVAQPKVDAAGHPVGAELLMRWTTEAFGNVSPVEFIPLAEKSGLIQLMGRHAAHAAAQLAAASAELGLPLPVAVNLSPKQLLEPGLDSLLLHACRRHDIAPRMLELELTESALVHNMDVVTPLLHKLRGHGFTLSLDDFGTGYSSLGYLRHLPFDKVKIDRSLVMDVPRDGPATRFLGHIVSACKALDMRTVAEGVETAEQAAALQAMGVDEFQGYHFSRPLPQDDWLALLRHAGPGALRLPLQTAPARPAAA